MNSLNISRVLLLGLAVAALGVSAQAQTFNPVEPPLPGSVQYDLVANHYTWVRTFDPIDVGVYVEDLMSDYRWNQPVGRGRIGIVTATNWNPGYNTMAAMVDFGRDYSVGIVFPEISAVRLVAVPEPSGVLAVLAGLGSLAALRRRR